MPNYPGSLDSLSNPTGSTQQDDPTLLHSAQHGTLNDIVEAIEAKLGTGASIAAVNQVLRATGAGATAFGAVQNGDLAGSIAVTKLVHVGAGNVLRSDGSQNVAGPVQAADIVAGAFPSRIGAVIGPLGSAQATLDWSSIPTAYTHLMLMLWVRSTAVVGEDVIYMRFNGGATSYYTQRGQFAAASAVGAEFLSETYARIGAIPGANAASTLFAPVVVKIPGYRATAGDKAWISEVFAPDALSSGNMVLRHSAGIWDNSGAITSISIGTAASIAAGSVACLYGFN